MWKLNNLIHLILNYIPEDKTLRMKSNMHNYTSMLINIKAE